MKVRHNYRLRPGYPRLWSLAAITAGPRLASSALIVTLVTVAMGTSGGLGGVLAASAAGQITPWTSTEAPVPANAGANPLASISSVACPASGSCVATGDYTDTSGSQQGLIETQSGATWTALEAPLPTTSNANSLVLLDAVVCPATGSCVATGQYTDAGGNQQGLIDALSGGTWTATKAPLPANAGGNPRASLGALACPAEGSCVATGDYSDSHENVRSTIETLSGGTWTAQEAPLPANAGVNPGSTIGAPACPADGSCVAMAEYTDTSGNVQTAIETLAGGVWTPHEAPLPADAAAPGHQRDLLGSVACPASGSCTTVGSFAATNGNVQGLIETLSEGNWTPTEAPLPSNAPTSNAFSALDVVTCPAVGACVALGWYYDSGDNYHTVAESLSGGTWTPTELPLPTHPAPRNPANPGQGIGGVSCPSTGSCIAVGSYFDKSHKDKAVIETMAGGLWSTIKAPLPTTSAATQASDLHDVTCSSDGACAAVGSSSGNVLIETMAGGQSPPAVSSPDQATFTVDQPGTFTVTATGTPTPFITEKGKLPKGLHFTSGTGSATISGTPTGAAGSYPLTVEAANGDPPTASQFFTLKLVAP
jgi:hypothetical protein